MPSCHFFFLTQLNKWHGSLIHLNRGNSHGDSLYNISSLYLESYSKYSNNLNLPQTHLQFRTLRSFLLRVAPQTLPYILSSFSGAPPKKSEHLQTFLLPSLSSNPFELNSNEFEFISFNHAISIFLRQAHFCESGEFIRASNFFPYPPLSFSSLEFFSA